MTQEIKLAIPDLKSALPGLSKVTGKGRSLPVLQTVRVTRNHDGVVTLQTTDLDSFLTYTTPGTQQGGVAEVLVPMDQLTKAVKCSREDIGISAESTDKVKLRYSIAGNGVEQTIPTLRVDQFPVMPQIRQPGVQVEPQFGQVLKEALQCTSDNPSRQIITGACLDVTDAKYHYVVGTNGTCLFSANSFSFALQKSVVIPNSRFLSWSDFMEDEPCFLSVEPPKEKETPGWIRIETNRWSFITRQVEGEFPKWKQVLPEINSKWARVEFSPEAVSQMLLVTPNLPGGDSQYAPVKLEVDKTFTIHARNKDDDHWTSIPVPQVTITGSPSSVHLNRNYLLKALRFGLTTLQIQDALTPLVFTSAGKKFVVMPIRPEEPPAKPVEEVSTQSIEPQPITTNERSEMPGTTTPEANPVNTKVTTPENTNVKSLVEQVDQIKDTLKGVIRDLNQVADTVKTAEKEKRTAEKEIEIIRAKLRQIQSVAI